MSRRLVVKESVLDIVQNKTDRRRKVIGTYALLVIDICRNKMLQCDLDSLMS